MFWLLAFLVAAAYQMVGAEVVWQMGSETMRVAVSTDGSCVYRLGPAFCLEMFSHVHAHFERELIYTIYNI